MAARPQPIDLHHESHRVGTSLNTRQVRRTDIRSDIEASLFGEIRFLHRFQRGLTPIPRISTHLTHISAQGHI